MDVSQIRSQLSHGGITAAVIRSADRHRGYTVHVITASGAEYCLNKTSDSEDTPRLFRSLDGAANTLEDIGFTEVKIEF